MKQSVRAIGQNDVVAPTHRLPIVCGIDIGSTNTKVVAVDPRSTVVARTQRATPRDPADLSIDAGGLRTLVEDMVIEVCGDSYAVVATSGVGVGEDGVPLDAALSPLAPALAWFDPRRSRMFTSIRDHLIDRPSVGVTPDPARTVVGWRWAHQEGQLARAASWVSVTDSVGAAWSGRAFMSDTIAARTAAWDGDTRSWIPESVNATLGNLDLLPPVLSAGTVVGSLRSDRLADAGCVGADAVVVVGGHDHPVGGWAVDRIAPNAILDSMGTAEVVVAQSRSRLHRTPTIDVAPGVGHPGTSLLCVEEFTRNVEWASLDPAVAVELRNLVVGVSTPDPAFDSDAFITGGPGGGRPRYSLDAPAAPLARASAVLGALARVGADAIRDVAALMPETAPVYVAGGWSRARGWVAIKERVTDQQMRVVEEPEVAAVGAAILAAEAIGWQISASDALGATH